VELESDPTLEGMNCERAGDRPRFRRRRACRYCTRHDQEPEVGLTESIAQTLVLSVWSVTIACFLLLWFVMPTLDHDCLSPCDGYAYAALGVLELGIALLILAKLLWIIRARVRR
jgi:hypothetical protein